MRTRIFPLTFCMLLILFVPLSVDARSVFYEFSGDFVPEDNGERLLALLVSLTAPEFLELRMDELPDDEGSVRALSLLVIGGSLGSFRIERFALESAFLQLTPPLTWRLGSRSSFQIRSALRSNFELMLKEGDIQQALQNYASESWSRILVKMEADEIYVKGTYRSEDAGLSIRTGIKTKLELRERKSVILKSPEIRINGEDKTELFQRDLDSIQPVIDFASFPLPLVIARLCVEEGKLVLATSIRPKPVEGIVYRYIQNPENPFSFRYREGFDYSEVQFWNGDLVFVSGRTWRSKIVSFLEKGPIAFSHTGIIRMINGSPHVIHASPDSEVVELEPIESFFSPEKVDCVRVCRVEDNLVAAEIASRKALEYYTDNTPFDTGFNTEDGSRLYCTELIWRAYMHGGINLAEGRWDYLHNPVLHGRLLLPYGLSQSPLLTEVFTLK